MDGSEETEADEGRILHHRTSTVLTLPFKVFGFAGLCLSGYLWVKVVLALPSVSDIPLWKNILGLVGIGYVTLLAIFLARLKGVTICDDGIETEGLFKREYVPSNRITGVSTFKYLGMVILFCWPACIKTVDPDGRKRSVYFLLRFAIPTAARHPDVILLKALLQAPPQTQDPIHSAVKP